MKEKKPMSRLAKLFDPKMFVYDFVKWTGALPVLVDLRVKRIYAGERPKHPFRGRYLISSNHMSFVDPVIVSDVFWPRRVGFIATKELFGGGWESMFRAFGCIPVDKENPSLKTFREVQERLENGHIVCVFPEGTVSRTEEMGAFKSGIVMMAQMAEAEILPVYLAKRKNRWRRQVAVIGQRIRLSDYRAGPMATLAEMETITRALAEKEEELEKIYHNYEEKTYGNSSV